MNKQQTLATGPPHLLMGPEDTAPPAEYRIFEFGELRTSKGTFVFDEAAAHEVLSNWTENGVDLSFDYGHAATRAGEAPAAGWFSLELRADGLWAVDINWTPRGAAQLAEREYRYVSPWFEYEEDSNRIISLVNLGLTNVPATLGAQPLVAHRTPEEEKMPKETMNHLPAVAAALGRDPGTPETQVVTEVLALRNFHTELLSVTGSTDRESAVGVITAWRDNANRAEQLSRRVEELESAAEEAERTTLIEEALSKRQLTPAQAAEGAFARTAPLATLRAYLATAPRFTGPTVSAPEQTETLSWESMDGPERAALFQSNPDLYQELRQQHLGR